MKGCKDTTTFFPLEPRAGAASLEIGRGRVAPKALSLALSLNQEIW